MIFLYIILVLVFLLGPFFWIKKRIKNIVDERNRVLDVLQKVNKIILGELDFEVVVQKIADAIPNELKFATGVVAILDEERSVLRRVAASRTKEATEAIKALTVPFTQIEIPLQDPNNLMAKSVREKKVFITNDSYDVLGPVLTREEAKKIQQIMGTKTTVIHPLYMENKPIGVFLASTKKYEKELKSYEFEIIEGFISGASIALQHALLYQDIKGRTNELRIANERLKELDHLKDDFVSIASHELRTPMTAIRSYAWMALHKADVPLSDKVEKYLVRTLMSAERLINLVNDMLNISRIEGGKIEINPEAVDLLELTNDVVNEAYHSKGIEKKIHFSILEERLPKVLADPEKLREVMLNILGNGVKFVPEGGKITISFFTDGKFVETSIKDSGPGITKEDLGKLFTKFGRLDNAYTALSTSGGTGLGLYISKSLIELMHGRIWATSDGVGKGAVFTFSLPVVI